MDLPNNNSKTSARLERQSPAPEAGLSLTVYIVDVDDDTHKSGAISGQVVDLSMQGMHIQITAVENKGLHIIKDHTTAFKNHLLVEIDLPVGKVTIEGFAVWYRQSEDLKYWNVGVYIKEMSSQDLALYEGYLTSVDKPVSAGTP